ncbi:Cytochrome P450 83B1 [Linum grandiflorum]
MAYLIYLLLALPILVLLFLLQKRTSLKNASFPPGPASLPLLGNLLQFDAAAPHRYLWRLSQTFGPLMSLRLGRIPIVVVSSAEMAEQVMKTHDLTFCSRPSTVGLKKMSYNCLDLVCAPYGAYWREMRKVCVVHLFNSIKTQSFGPMREYEVSKMVDKISTSSKPFNLSEAMMSLTSTITCRMAFGKRFEEQGTERSRFNSLLNESQAMLTSFFFADYFPVLGFIDKVTGLNTRLNKNFKELDSFYQEIIDEHLDPDRVKPEQEDILDVLLQILKDPSFKVQLTFDHIKAILTDIFIAGTDTSAITVIWVMTYLMKHPRAMRKAQEEVRRQVGNKGFVNEEDIHQLSYLKDVVKEVLRLQPAAPLLVPRESTEKCLLGGYEIPAKTMVHVNAWAVGRDPEAWGEDAEEFKPERFTGKCIDMKGANFELIPFGAGRRICPGMHMGISTVELSLANLIYAFNWDTPAGMKDQVLDMDVLPGIAMHKKNPLLLLPTNWL